MRLALAIVLGCTLKPALGYGQPFSVDRYQTGGGGTSVDSQYSITGSIGQYDAGPDALVEGTFSEIGGYWNLDSFFAGPIIACLTNQTIRPDDQLAINVEAGDPKANQLTFSLDPGVPDGAQINPTNGCFLWVPSRAQASSSNFITVRATETAFPSLSSTANLVVFVTDYLELTVGSANVISGQTALVPLTLSSSEGVTNIAFTIQVSDTIFTNWSISTTAPEVGSATVTDQGMSVLIAIQASSGQMLSGTEQLAQLSFLAVPKSPSAFVSLPVGNVSAAKPDGSAYANYITQSGLVTLVQNAPLLTACITPGSQRNLTFYGLPGVNYQVQYATHLNPPVVWTPLLNYTQTNGIISINVPTTDGIVFYRLSRSSQQ
ncbi:MAG: cadherin repeat domain-containing protein [Limisphaerales bacterium]